MAGRGNICQRPLGFSMADLLAIRSIRTTQAHILHPIQSKEIDVKKIKQAIETLRMEGWVAAADRLQVLLGLLPPV